MARIPDSELDRLKREVSLERLVEAQGIPLARHGADLLGLCPFHEDREPSLVVSPKKNLWHCLGACQTGGSVIDWAASFGVSKNAASDTSCRLASPPEKVINSDSISSNEWIRHIIGYNQDAHISLKSNNHWRRFFEDYATILSF